jgi:hypothetical protein
MTKIGDAERDFQTLVIPDLIRDPSTGAERIDPGSSPG